MHKKMKCCVAIRKNVWPYMDLIAMFCCRSKLGSYSVHTRRPLQPGFTRWWWIFYVTYRRRPQFIQDLHGCDYRPLYRSQLYLKMKDTPKVRKLRVASLYYTTKAKQKNNKLLGGRHNMPPPFSSLSRHRSASRRRAYRACRPKRSSRFPRSICSHGYRCSSWRVNAAVSKGSWWPWHLTSWPWK